MNQIFSDLFKDQGRISEIQGSTLFIDNVQFSKAISEIEQKLFDDLKQPQSEERMTEDP